MLYMYMYIYICVYVYIYICIYILHFLSSTLYWPMLNIIVYTFLYTSHEKILIYWETSLANKIMPLYSLIYRSYSPQSLPELLGSFLLHSDAPSPWTQWTQSHTHILFYPMKGQALFCKISPGKICSLIPRIPTQ